VGSAQDAADKTSWLKYLADKTRFFNHWASAQGCRCACRQEQTAHRAAQTGALAAMCDCDHRLLTLKQAAFELGLPYFKVQRAAKAELFPKYRLFNSRQYVRLAEIEAALLVLPSPNDAVSRPVNASSPEPKPLTAM
jgi:hypothetical protein